MADIGDVYIKYIPVFCFIDRDRVIKVLCSLSVNSNCKQLAAVDSIPKVFILCELFEFRQDPGGKFAGIVTERDIVSAATDCSVDFESTTVAQIMTTQVVSCSRDTPAGKARQIMAANHIRHLPIIDND